MKAIVCTKYGSPDVLELKEVAKPIPKEDEVMLEIHAASVNAGDLETLRGEWSARFGGPRRPMHKIPGTDLAGRVEAVGVNVKQFRPGDEVWGDLSFPYGFGTFAEYVCVSENALALKPTSMTYEEAATYPHSAVVALQGLRRPPMGTGSGDKRLIQPGQKVLINGAGGGMGTFAVQIAKYFGAEVTGVDSASKFDMLRSLGADAVIDYTQEDYTKTGQLYDLILDVVARRSVFAYRRALSPEGTFVIVGGSLGTILQVATIGIIISRTGGKKIGINSWEPNKKEDLALLAELFETEEVVPVIDRQYPLNEVPEAFRYIEGGHVQGKVVITMKHDNKT
jgi:NADPH:quinone reductase-like Zn-dependent oxidoreductase